MRPYITEKREREREVLSFSEFLGNLYGLKMKNPTFSCFVLCAVHPQFLVANFDFFFKKKKILFTKKIKNEVKHY